MVQLAKKQGISLAVANWFSIEKMAGLLSLNRDIFIRSLVLQLCFSFMTFYAARIGETTLAANAVLLNFLMLVSFAIDGIAYASEAKVGQAKGQKSVEKIRLWVKISVFWGMLFGIFYSVFFIYRYIYILSIYIYIYIYILTTPTAIHHRPMLFGIWQRGQREEMSATFLEVRGRPCALFGVLVGVGEPGEPEKKKARGRSCLALDLLRHGLGGFWTS